MVDTLDRKILYLLDTDGRKTFAEISRELKIPQETARYRMKQLLDNKIIHSFFTIIDAGKLENNYFKILLKCMNVNEVQMQNIAQYLTQQDAVNWVARLEGSWDFSFTIRVRQVSEFSTFLDTFKHRFHTFLTRLTMAVNIQVDFFARDYLVGDRRKAENFIGYTAPNGPPITSDKTDLTILRVLAESPRLALSDLAQQANISELTARSRFDKLKKVGIFQGTRLTINPDALGILNYYILLYLHPVPQKRLREFVTYCRANSRATYLVKALGDWDYELNLEVISVKQYREIMMGLTKEFSDVIKDYTGMMVNEVLKLTLTP